MLSFSNDFVFDEQILVIYDGVKVIGSAYLDGSIRLDRCDCSLSDLAELVTKLTNQINGKSFDPRDRLNYVDQLLTDDHFKKCFTVFALENEDKFKQSFGSRLFYALKNEQI